MLNSRQHAHQYCTYRQPNPWNFISTFNVSKLSTDKLTANCQRYILHLYYKNRKHLSVCLCHGQHAVSDRRYFLAPCDKRKHTGHTHQQAASHASTDSACRHPVWLSHNSLGFQRPVGRRSYHNKLACAALLRLTPQATIAQSVIVACRAIVACKYYKCFQSKYLQGSFKEINLFHTLYKNTSCQKFPWQFYIIITTCVMHAHSKPLSDKQ